MVDGFVMYIDAGRGMREYRSFYAEAQFDPEEYAGSTLSITSSRTTNSISEDLRADAEAATDRRSVARTPSAGLRRSPAGLVARAHSPPPFSRSRHRLEQL